MLIGITWNFNEPEECAWAEDLHPQITKVGWDPASMPVSWGRGFARNLRDRYDCETVLDLRTENVQEFVERAGAHGGGVYDWWIEWVRAIVEETAGEVRYWEVWGEAGCPYLAGAWQDAEVADPHRDTNYAELLTITHEVIKSVDPEALVLIGGNTVDTHKRYYERVAAATGGRAHDWNCTHPFCFKRVWEDVETEYNAFFDTLAAIDARHGVAHPLCMTEFGWPTHPGGDFRTREDLQSFVYDRVLTCSEAEAADWTRRCFDLFRERDVRFCVVVGMKDVGRGSHWGSRLGVRCHDGTPKPMWFVLKEEIAQARAS